MVSIINDIGLTDNITISVPKSKGQIKPNNTALQQDTFEKSGLTKKQKRNLIAAGTAIIVLIGAAIINKQRRAKAIKQIPEELRTIFRELKGEKGESFINKSYEKLRRYMKLDGIAPDKIIRTGADANSFSVQGGFNPTLNTIGYSNGFFDNLGKAEQFSLLAHELKHAEQTSKIIRSGLMPEYAKAWGEQLVNSAQNDPLNFTFRMAHNNAKRNGKEAEFIEQCITNCTNETLTNMQKSHKNTLNLPKFPKGSAEYEDAKRYIDASREYKGLGFLGTTSEEYYNNPLEQEAYGFGNKMKKYFNNFFG